MLDCMETMKKKCFFHQGEDTDAIQALLGKCVLLLLTANRALCKDDNILVSYKWQTSV